MAFSFQTIQYILKPDIFCGNLFLCPLNDGRLQAKPPGNGKGIGFARHTGKQLIGRLQGFDIKFTGGIFHAVSGQGKYLQFGIMGGSRHQRTHLSAIFNDGNRQCCAFLWVRTGTQFVKQDQIIRSALFHNCNGIFHMCREGGQRLLNALLITDIRVNVAEQTDRTLLIGRNMHAGGCHQAQQTQGLEADRLAAGIRSGDNQRVIVITQRNINGHGFFLVQQRMSCTNQIYLCGFTELRCTGIQLEGIICLGKNKIQLAQYIIICADGIRKTCHIRGQLCQDTFNFGFFLALQDFNLVVCVNHLRRFDKQRGTGGRNVMYHARNVAPVLTLDWNYIPPVTLGNQVFLQVFGIGGGRNKMVQCLTDTYILLPHLPADVCQLGRCPIGNFLFADDGTADFLLQIFVAVDSGKQRIQ